MYKITKTIKKPIVDSRPPIRGKKDRTVYIGLKKNIIPNTSPNQQTIS